MGKQIKLNDDRSQAVDDRLTPQQEAAMLEAYRKESEDFPPAEEWDLDTVARPIA